MEFHQLRYFVEVVRQKNFSRAAQVCHVSQPSLSQQLKKLEEELGQPLICRGRQGATLTEFGESMLPQALQILSAARNMTEEASFGKGEFAGRVSIGAIPTVAPYLLPKLMQAVIRGFPKIQLSIVENTTDELVAQIRDGNLDFALLSPPFEGDQEMESVALLDDELLVVLSKKHALAEKRLLRLRDLNEFPMVVMKDVHCLSRQSISLCETSGLKPWVSLESAQLETVVSMVEAGMGFSFVPKMAQKSFERRDINFSSVAPALVTRRISLVSSKYKKLSSTQAAFRTLVQECLSDE
jgi:LysR family transcriptional regulator, hydrogen peroxide-inducible genes activator